MYIAASNMYGKYLQAIYNTISLHISKFQLTARCTEKSTN